MKLLDRIGETKIMKLNDLLNVIDSLQDFKLMDFETGKSLTDVTYTDDIVEKSVIDNYSDWYVRGLSVESREMDYEPYIIITISQSV